MGGGEVLKKGWLIKSPPLEGGGGMKNWRKRWFCLRSSKVLEYYRSEDGELKGVINLEDCRAVNSGLYHKKHKYVFDLDTRDRTYYLVAKSEEEMKEWVNAIVGICSFASWVPATAAATVPAAPLPPHQTPASGAPAISPPRVEQQGGGIPFSDRFRPPQDGGASSEMLYSLATAVSEEVRYGKTPHTGGRGGSGGGGGIPLTEALASKGFGPRKRSTSASDMNRSGSMSGSGLFEPRGVENNLFGLFSPDSPTTATTYSVPSGRYAKPRSVTVNPTAVPQTFTDSSDFAQGVEQSTAMLDSIYVSPRSVEAERHFSTYDQVPLARSHAPTASAAAPRPSSAGAKTSGDFSGGSFLQQVWREEGRATMPSLDSSHVEEHHYMNLKYLQEQLLQGGEVPPPIDRSTKPRAPTVNRGLKPHQFSTRGESCPIFPPTSISEESSSNEEEEEQEESDEYVLPLLDGGAGVEPTGAAEMVPKPTPRSIAYMDVCFDQQTKKPVPLGRKKKLNYVQVDLNATNTLARERSTLSREGRTSEEDEPHHQQEAQGRRRAGEEEGEGEGEGEGQSELAVEEGSTADSKRYVNITRDGSINDDTDPDYYTHMRGFAILDADKPPTYMQFLKHQRDNNDEGEEIYEDPRDTG